MKIKITQYLNFLLYTVFYIHIANVIFDMKLISYLILAIIVISLISFFTFTSIPREIYSSIFFSIVFFILSSLSLIQAEDLNWSIKALGSFSFRLLTLLLAAVIVNRMGVEYLVRKFDSLWYVIITLAFFWLSGLFSYLNMWVNYENVGSSLILCLAPILLYKRKYYKLVISVILIYLMGSRTATFLMIMFLAYSYIFIYSKMKVGAAISFITSLLLIIIIFYILSGQTIHNDLMSTFNPTSPPEKGDYDWVRTYHNYYGYKILSENLFYGVGIGGFQLSLEEFIGRQVNPHNFIFFFSAQMGVFSLILFLVMSLYSIKPLFDKAGRQKNEFSLQQAIGLSNAISFLYYLTRPQGDNFIYFALVGAALGMNYKVKYQLK